MKPLRYIEAIGVGLTVGLMVFLMVSVAMGRSIVPATFRGQEPITAGVIDLDPQSLFTNNCAVCHQATGVGVPGQFPPLAGSTWVLEDPETPVRVMLLGIQGPIEVSGRQFNGVMPSQAHLNDEQISLLATFIRSQWGNTAPEVTPETVAAVRASLGGRATPWNGGAELQSVRGQ